MTTFVDLLPLYGEVKVPGTDEIFVYVGFEGNNTRRCALNPKGFANVVWYDRTVIKPVSAD